MSVSGGDNPVSDPLGATAVATTGNSAPAAAERGALPRGTRVGRYVIEAQLGVGGMGSVFRALDPELERAVAIKILHPHLAGMQSRLLREGKAVAKLRHPNVVSIYDVGSHEAALFIAMELVDGTTLGAWLATAKRSPAAIVDAFVQAGRGLAAAHAAELVHRDFKPDNVLVGRDGRVVVTDFGLVRGVDDEDRGSSTTPAPATIDLTQTGAVIGTPMYMAPEQFAGGSIDARTDQFSFCVALFEALCGRRPFAGKTFDEIKRSVESGVIAKPATGREVPAELYRAIVRGLSRDPGARFPSMTALLAALTTKRSRAKLAVAIAVPLVAAGAIAAFVGRREPPREAAPIAKPPTADVACDEVAARSARYWNAAAREKATSKPDDFMAADVAQLDAYVARWTRLRTTACRARDEVREKCLDLALLSLARVTGSLEPKPKRGWLALPALSRCEAGKSPPAIVSLGERSPAHDDYLISPDGTRFALGGSERFYVTTIGRDHTRRSLVLPKGTVVRDWPDDAHVTLWSPSDQMLSTFELATAKITPRAHLRGSVIALSGDLAFTRLDSTKSAMESLTGATLDETYEIGNYWFTATISPDGRYLAAGDLNDRSFTIYDRVQHTETKIRYRATSGMIGVSASAWLDARHLLVSGRAGDDQGQGLWGFVADENGVFAEAPELVLDAEPTFGFTRLDIRAGHVLAVRTSTREELARIVARKSEPVGNRMQASLVDVTKNGKSLLFRRAFAQGLLSTSDDVVTALDTGVHVIQGDRVFPFPRTNSQIVTCARDVDRCVIVDANPAVTRLELRIVDHDKPAPTTTAVAIPSESPSGTRPFIYAAVSPDGKQLALTTLPLVVGRAYVFVIDIATGKLTTRLLPENGCNAQMVAWISNDEVATSVNCNGVSEVLAIRGAKPPSSLYLGEGWISGIAIDGDGTLYVSERHYDNELVKVEGL